MLDASYTLLYVDNPASSAAFYEDLLGRKPVESSPSFAMFVMPSGLKLGLWSRHTAEPAVTATSGGCEIGFPVDGKPKVDATCADWTKRGLKILQAPVELDFGRTFVALDPDGHRLRVFALNA